MICKILSSENTVVHEDVQAVSVPGINGRLQILPKHAELFQTLTKGPIVIKKKGSADTTIEMTQGTCHFYNGTLAIIL